MTRIPSPAVAPSPAVVAAPGAIALMASALAGAIGVVFIVLMYAAFAVGATSPGMAFGWINDVAVLVQYALAVPGVLAVGAALQPTSPGLARLGTWLALAGIVVIVAFQALLVAGMLTFEQEIGPASAGFLLLGVWMVAAAVAGRRAGAPPVGPWTALAAALYLGYPVWALRVSRWIRAATDPGEAIGRPSANA